MKDKMIFKFSSYGFLKNLRFYEPFLLLFFRSHGLSFLLIGVLISIREISIQILEIPTGVIADVTGKRKSMIFSFSSYVIAFIIFSLGHGSFGLYALAMIIFGTGEAFRTGTHKAIIFDWLDQEGKSDQKVSYYGTTRAWSKIGSAVSSIIAAILIISLDSYSIIFPATIIPAFLGLLLMISYPKSIDENRHPLTKGIFKELLLHFKISIKSIFKNKHLLRALLNSASYEGNFKITKSYLQPMIAQYGSLLLLSLFPILVTLGDKQQTALLLGIFSVFIFLASALASKKASRVSQLFNSQPKAINFISFSSAALILSLLFFITQELILMAGVVFTLLHTMQNLRKPIIIGYMSDIIDKKQRSTILSINSQLKSFVAMILAPPLGFIADKWGLIALFLTSGGLMLIFTLLLRIKQRSSGLKS